MNRGTIVRWLKRLFLGLVVLVTFLIFVVFPVGMSYLITNSRFRFPERGVRSPAEAGLAVTSVEFKTSDGILLKGWWNAGRPDKPIIIFSHGWNRSRLELLEQAAESHKRGYGVLLFDLRNHGESGTAYTTLGINESLDICAAQKFVNDLERNRPLVLWGVSLGASTGILGAKRCHGFSAIIADSAFLSFRETIKHHFRLFFRVPSFPIADLIIFITSVRMGFDPDDGDVEAAVRQVGIPILFIAGGQDRRMPPALAERMLKAATHPQKKLFVVPSAGHGDAFEEDPAEYLKSVYRFLDEVRYNRPLDGNSNKGAAGSSLDGSGLRGVINTRRLP
ncbi:MAG: alpha/beta hydrolase [Acidobacteria bacterium]|nr:alpha/beta hydrolase [Acidobacteriota bacterium]